MLLKQDNSMPKSYSKKPNSRLTALKFLPFFFMETENLIPCSEEPANGNYSWTYDPLHIIPFTSRSSKLSFQFFQLKWCTRVGTLIVATIYLQLIQN